MDIKLGQPAIQNFDKKIESKSQSTSLSSFNQKAPADKTPANGFSSKLEKSLEKKGPENKSDSVAVENKAAAPKQEYSRNTKINPPKPGETSRLDLPKSEKTASTENKEKPQAADGHAVPADLAWLLNMNMQTQVQGEAAPKSEDKISDVSMEKKIFNPAVEGKVSPEILPVLKFMKAMSENFKIPPEKIMQAFESLPTDTLMQRPQAAVTELMQKLEIQPRQFTKAQILFNQMVSELEKVTNPQGPTDGFKTKPMAFNPEIGKSHAAAHSEKGQTLQDIKSMVQEVSPNQMKALNVQSMQASQMPQPAHVMNKQAQAQMQAINTQNMSVTDMEALLKKMEAPQGEFKYLDAPQGKNLKPMDFDSFVNKMAMEKSNASPIQGEADLAFGDDMEEFSSEDLSDEVLAQLKDMPGDKATNIQKVLENVMAQNSPQAKAENTQMISKEAQLLVQKGGGEMKIQLRPEGMGDVILKVKVQDGQVGVQMTADTPHAKKLLESSLSDLKMSLAEHKLHLHEIKVDVSDKMNDQFANQNSNFNRDEAREFLGQFRQQNESFRNGFMSNPGARQYSQSTQAAPDIQPMDTTNKKSSDNGRLYLVA